MSDQDVDKVGFLVGFMWPTHKASCAKESLRSIRAVVRLEKASDRV